MKLYRYDDCFDSNFFSGLRIPDIELREFYVIKETPCGYWIDVIQHSDWVLKEQGMRGSGCRWVEKAPNKFARRYAYTSKDDALYSYIKRKEKQLKLVKQQVKETEQRLCLVLKMQEEGKHASGKELVIDKFF